MIAPDVQEFVVAYLTPTLTNVSTFMPDEPPYPYYVVKRITGAQSWVDDYPVVSVHAFHSTDALAAQAASAMHALMNPWVLTPKVVVMVGGVPTSIDSLEVLEAPSWQDYNDKTVQRYCARYKITTRVNLPA